MKKSGRMLSMLLAVAVMLSFAIQPAFAATNTYDEENRAISMDGMDQFMKLTDSGTIQFDTAGALSAGYSEKSVATVSTQIDGMNQLVVNGNASIDDTFTATVYFMGTRAKGQSKVVTHWYGLTEVYMNSDEAAELIAGLSTVGDATTITGLVGLLPGPIASAIGGISGILGFGTMIYRWQVEAAAKPGNGIIMNIQTNFTDGTQSIWFTSQ